MDTRVLVVSLGRVLADHVRVDAAEAYAVVLHLWERIQNSRDDRAAVMALPPLDTMGITPFGDFELRQAALRGPHRMRPPHQLTQELGALLLRLLASADPGLNKAPQVCVDIARRASSIGSRGQGARPIIAPDALLMALDAFRPRDPSAALAGLYARWRRTTDRNHVTPWDESVPIDPLPGERHTGGERELFATYGPPPSASRRSIAWLVVLACLMALVP